MSKYQIIYADPPWRYNNRVTHKADGPRPKFGGGAGQHYPMMADEEIIGMATQIQAIAAENCALLLWATMPRLPLALKVIEAWGFRYATNAFTWVKTNPKAGTPFIGPGYYTASNSEICLLGVRGRIAPVRRLVSSVVITPRREHSRKPDEVRERIVEAFGDLPRVELFCRYPAAGWDSHGNALDGRDIREALS